MGCWGVHQSPVASVRGYYRLGGLNQHRFIPYRFISGGKKFSFSLTQLKLRCRPSWFLLEVLVENPFFFFSSFQRLSALLGLWPHHSTPCFHGLMSSHLSALPSLLLYRPCHYIGCTYRLQDYLPNKKSLTYADLQNVFYRIR